MLIVVVAVVALGLAATAIGGVVTSAQEGDGPIGSFLGKVAEKLGVSQEDLETAIQEARIETIDEAVAEGRLTEERAARLKERAAEGGRLFPRFRRGHGHVVDAAAEVLDIPKDELIEGLKDGSSLADLAEAQGMSVEEFSGALLTQVQAQLDDQVAEDKLTREQADQMLQRFEENIDRIVNGHPDGDGPCHRGHCRRSHAAPEAEEASEVIA